MSTLTTSKKSRQAPVRSRVRKPKTMEAFLQWDQPEGNYKYEWVDDRLEKSEYMMKTTELILFAKVERAFNQSQAHQAGGHLVSEALVPVSEARVRIPDISFFTEPQIVDAAQGIRPVPTFAIEIISPSESGFKIEQKALDYFGAGVQVLWQIYPNVGIVRVLTSPRDVRVCLEEDVCTAAPAIPDLQISVAELFSKTL